MSTNITPKTWKLWPGLALAIIAVCATTLHSADNTPTAPAQIKLELSGPATQPTSLPVCFNLNLTNLRKEPISYGCGGPADYPQGDYFSAIITPAAGGEAQALSCFNGQYQEGAAWGNFQIRNGTTIKIPLTLKPLPAGQYDVVIETGQHKYDDAATAFWPGGRSNALRITIKDDAQLAEATRSAWVDRICKGEAVAECMVEEYKDAGVIAKLVPIIAGDDEKAATSAAGVLWQLEAKDLPAETGAAVVKGMDKRLQRRAQPSFATPDRLLSLSMIASRLGSDEVLPAVIKLAHAENVYSEVRARAVEHLTNFRQPQVLDELKSLAKDSDEWVRSNAAIALAQRKDPAAVPVLLDLIKTKKYFRARQIDALANFPDDPAARAAIEQSKTGQAPTTRQ